MEHNSTLHTKPPSSPMVSHTSPNDTNLDTSTTWAYKNRDQKMNYLKDSETDKEYLIELISVMFPSGKNGLKVRVINSKLPDDLGTLVIQNGKLKIVQW